MSYERGPQGIQGPAGPAGSTGATGATGSTEGLQYILSGTTINGIVTNPRGTGAGNLWAQNTWLVASSIQFNTPPNWSAGNFVVWDGWALYDFNTAQSNYWSVYYKTSTDATERPLIGDKLTGVLNAITNLNAAQFYFPLNVLIPPTYVTTGGTITLIIYGYTISAGAFLASTPSVNSRVSVTLD